MSVQRKSSPSPKSPAAESDLETTAELPVLDVAAYEAATTEERLGNTDTWIIQSPLACESKEAPGTAAARVASTPAAAVGAAVPSGVADESRALGDRRPHDDRRTHESAPPEEGRPSFAFRQSARGGGASQAQYGERRLKSNRPRCSPIPSVLSLNKHWQQLTAELVRRAPRWRWPRPV